MTDFIYFFIFTSNNHFEMGNRENRFRIVVKTLKGLENVLKGELLQLEVDDVRVFTRAVSFFGNKEMLYKSNLLLRTAQSVLMPVGSFSIRNGDELYNQVYKIPWDSYFGNNQSIMIEPVVKSELFRHTLFAAQKAKDAIADYFRNKTGKRPDVDKENPAIRINLHINKDHCTISLNSSGEPLFKRGYRQETDIAPINEILAAGMIILSGWDRKRSLIDPMCGSGTILIEAAMIAAGMAPNLRRQSFSFFNWNDIDINLGSSLRKSAEEKISNFEVPLTGYDVSPRAFRIAKENIRNAGFDKEIRLSCSSFTEMKANTGSFIITNPPYGERIATDDIIQLYKQFSSTLSEKVKSADVYIITSNREALKEIEFKQASAHELMNGRLSCQFVNFKT
ncbi:MAG: THUMP domain-containing protein [Bacteroidota bacterium]